MGTGDHQRKLKTLHLWLVLSFINTGLFLLWELLPNKSELLTTHHEQIPDVYSILVERAQAIPQWYYILSSVLDAFSIAGMVLMWRLRKNGFYCYSLAKCLLMLMPILFLDRSYVGIGNMMICAFFIIYYYTLMRALGTFSTPSDQPEPTDTSNNQE